jgi:hypothetical protein
MCARFTVLSDTPIERKSWRADSGASKISVGKRIIAATNVYSREVKNILVSVVANID